MDCLRLKSRLEYKARIGGAKHLVPLILHDLELKRRREEQNLEHRTYYEALNSLKDLLSKIDSFETAVRKGS